MDIFDNNVKLRTQEFIPDVIPTMTKAMKSYARLYMCHDRLTPEPIEQTIEKMQKAGITKALVRASNAEQNELVAKLCEDYPDLFYGFASISYERGVTQCFDDLKHAYEKLGMRGLSLGPMFTGVYVNDAKNYPLLALTDSESKIMVSHTALHFNPELPYDLGHPQFLDRVAAEFPNMKIILGHAGLGFGALGVSVAHRHRNVYLDFSAIAPEIIQPDIVFAANTYLRKKCLFGTSYPLIDFDVVDRWKNTIAESNHQLFFHDNMAKLMGLME